MDNKKIRIVHIVQSSGGVERYLQSLLKYMKYEKYENILICSNVYKEKNYKDLVEAFVNVDMIRTIKLYKDLKAVYTVRKLLKQYNADFVYLHSSKAGAIGRIANIGLHNYCIYNPHGWAFNMQDKKIKQWIYIAIEKILSLFCDVIVCISDAEKRSAIERKICNSKKLSVIYNGIDFEEYNFEESFITRESLGISKDSFIVGVVGRLSKQKAPEIFVEASKIIKNQIKNAYFLMVGDGEDRRIIEQMIQENDLKDSFKITGWVNNPMAYIKLFDVGMLLSRWEGFGLVLPEYMLARKPIIATKVDAIPYIISNDKNGILVEVDDYRAVAESTIKLFESPEFANYIIKNGSKLVLDKFNIKRVVEEHEKLFERLIVSQRKKI